MGVKSFDLTVRIWRLSVKHLSNETEQPCAMAYDVSP